MKKTLVILVLLFSSSVVAEDISDFQIEGMSVGDSALDYFNEKYINNKGKITYPSSDKFYGITITDNTNDISFNTYEKVKLHFKKNDNNYTIVSVSGLILYPNNFQNCRKEQKKIVNEIKDAFNFTNLKNTEDNFGGKGGKSIAYITTFRVFNDTIRIWCTNWDKKNKNTKNWTDSLNVGVSTKEILDWLSNEAYQ